MNRRQPRSIVSLLLVAVALATSPALADRTAKEPSAKETRPWAKGVSQERREKAIVLFREANSLLKDSVFVQAADRYREALKQWDHPAIHYNLVLALLNLDQPVDVYQHLEQAMRHGPEPLDQDKFDQAKAYLTLVSAQIVKVDIRCELEGTRVVLDGRPLFTAPGRYQGLIRAGPHTVLATKPGYVTNQISRTWAGGEEMDLALQLYTDSQLTRYRYKMPAWIPYTVLGAGVAVAAGGGVMHFTARQQFSAFDSGVEQCAVDQAADPNSRNGCTPSPQLAAMRVNGQRFQNFALGGYVAGGALALTGAVLALINQPEVYKVTAEELEQEKVTVHPILAPGSAGVAATVQF